MVGQVDILQHASILIAGAGRYKGIQYLIQSLSGYVAICACSEISRLASALGVAAVFANRDYEPQAKARDATVAAALGSLEIGFESFKDQVVFDGSAVLTQTGRPYTVFTPHKKAWLKRLTDDDLAAPMAERGRLATCLAQPACRRWKTSASSLPVCCTGLSELIWRDFYFMILDRLPRVVECSFKPEYDAIIWENGDYADTLFTAGCEARTGYPLVDAAMRQLNRTGYMHNRLRLVVASLLTKDLGIDWRHGEAYFARHLNDFDLSANNGGWQWAASSGCDAQPYFRIFNPVTQSERFDPDGRFIRHYLPEFSAVPDKFIHALWCMNSAEPSACGVIVGRNTPTPLVEHDEARRRTLERYGVIKRAVAA